MDDNHVIKVDDIYHYDSGIEFEESPDGLEYLEYLPDRLDYINEIFDSCLDRLLDGENSISEISKEIKEIIIHALDNEKKTLLERIYSDDEKEHYISSLGKDDRLKSASEAELTVYRKFVDELCGKDNLTALKCKGYGCYGGNEAYDCDWNISLKCVKRLYELTGEAVYANTLGYIYYYGRCWDGQPQYDEAFRYFSIGASGYFYESRYKLADMFANGYGVQKNTGIARSIVNELYDENIKYIMNGDFNCKFADIALRLGSYKEQGLFGYSDVYTAYAYYLQADFAIRQRLLYDYFGDITVATSIRQSIDRLLETGKIKKPVRTAAVAPRGLLSNYLKQYRRLQLNIKPLKSGDLKISIRIVPFNEEKYPPKLFITETKTGFCGLVEMLNLRVKNPLIEDLEDINETVYFDDIVFYYDMVFSSDTDSDAPDGIGFVLGRSVQVIIAGDWYFTSPAKSSGKKYRFASVYFTPDGKRYDYLLDIDGISVGDKVIVITDGGRTEVTVANIAEKTESELALPIGKYKKIIEKA